VLERTRLIVVQIVADTRFDCKICDLVGIGAPARTSLPIGCSENGLNSDVRVLRPTPDRTDVCRRASFAGILPIPLRPFKAMPSACAIGTIGHSVSSSLKQIQEVTS
jgi:hypothetical protein